MYHLLSRRVKTCCSLLHFIPYPGSFALRNPLNRRPRKEQSGANDFYTITLDPYTHFARPHIRTRRSRITEDDEYGARLIFTTRLTLPKLDVKKPARMPAYFMAGAKG